MDHSESVCVFQAPCQVELENWVNSILSIRVKSTPSPLNVDHPVVELWSRETDDFTSEVSVLTWESTLYYTIGRTVFLHYFSLPRRRTSVFRPSLFFASSSRSSWRKWREKNECAPSHRLSTDTQRQMFLGPSFTEEKKLASKQVLPSANYSNHHTF